MIAHGQPEYLRETLAGLSAQTIACDHITIVDTSSDESCGSIIDDFVASNQHALKIRADEKTRLPESISLAFGSLVPEADHWVWLLHDDSAPEPTALAELLRTVEVSPSVAMVGPKQVNWENPRIIAQMGISLTPLGNPINPYSSEFDQGQHDSIDDVFAIGTAGALIRSSIYAELDGIDPNAPELAADIDLSIRVRLAGHRVVLAPLAKVRHASLSLAGKRPKSWLRTNPKSALRRATIHLRLTHSPLALALVFWLLLDEIGILRTVGRIASKRPQLIWTEISSAVWGIFHVFGALRSRSIAQRSKKLSFASLKPLRASWPQVFAAARKQADREETQAKLTAFAQSDEDVTDEVTNKSFVESGALWLALALLAIAGLSAIPSNLALVGPGSSPLSTKWIELFSNAGASFQHLGLGVAAPADPWTWVLLLLGSTTFWAPSLGVAIFVFLARPLAFAGAWRFIGLFTEKAWIKNLASVIFALVPAFTFAIAQADLTTVVVFVTLPWLAFTISRAAGWGDSPRSSTSVWTWVGVSGLLLVATAAASPSLGLALLVILGAICLVRITRFGYLVWIALPMAALFAPVIVNAFTTLGNPLVLLADPGLQPPSADLRGIWFVATADAWLALAWLIPMLLALLALLTKKWANAAAVWLVAFLGLAGAWLASGITQLGEDFEPIGVNVEPWFALTAVALVAAAAIALHQSPTPKISASTMTALAAVPLAVLVTLTPTTYRFTDGRVAPSIVAAEAASGSGLKTLAINPKSTQELSAAIIWGDGIQQDELSLAYRYSPSKSNGDSDHQSALYRLVANLASANGTSVIEQLQDLEIGYVLIPASDSSIASELGLAFDSVAELEPVGATDFGRLWRVREAKAVTKATEPGFNTIWSITKAVQLSVLGAFILLALPTRRRRRKKAQDTELFDSQFANEAN